MKKITTLFMLAGFTIAACAQDNKEPFSTRSLSNESIKDVHVRTSGGSIAVTGVASDARIEVYVQPSNGMFNSLSKEEIQKRLDEDYELTISVANNQLTATAKQKKDFNNWKRALSISFKIFVPKTVNTDLATSGGSIRLAGLSGKQNFKTSGGSLSVDDITGSINGKTSGGSITVKNAGSNIDMATSGGSIRAENCNGTILLNTSGGSLNLNNLQGNIKARTSGGSIHGNSIKGELVAHTSGGSVSLNDISGSLETSTSGGSVHADLKELGQYVTINNSGGNISLTLPENKGLNLKLYANKIRTDGLKNFNGKADDDEISGTVNGGGIPVTVKASSGHLNIKM
jgi:DUF4097 and DUF4098 domain-containing protein YvlB